MKKLDILLPRAKDPEWPEAIVRVGNQDELVVRMLTVYIAVPASVFATKSGQSARANARFPWASAVGAPTKADAKAGRGAAAAAKGLRGGEHGSIGAGDGGRVVEAIGIPLPLVHCVFSLLIF